jgi:phosphoenolpyruvate carboxylase
VAAADEEMMAEYAALVEDPTIGERFLGQILAEYDIAKQVLGRLYPSQRSSRRPRLTKAVAIRRNALIRLHREQIRLLRTWREAVRTHSSEAQDHLSSLLVTVNAIAGGLKTTG